MVEGGGGSSVTTTTIDGGSVVTTTAVPPAEFATPFGNPADFQLGVGSPVGEGTSQSFGNEFSNVFAVTDMVLQNPTGDIGMVQISRDGHVLLSSCARELPRPRSALRRAVHVPTGSEPDHDDHVQDARTRVVRVHDVRVVRRLRQVTRRDAGRTAGRRGRAGRCALVALLIAATTSWVGEQPTSAASPAELISVSTTGVGPLSTQDVMPSISADGSVVVFTAVPPPGTEFGSDQVFVRNRTSGTTSALPPAFNVAATTGGVLSRDGCHVGYWGYFSGLTIFPFINIPPQWEIYSWDRCTAGSQPVVVSTASDFPTLTDAGATLGPLAISSDGRYIVYVAVPGTGSAPRDLADRPERADREPPVGDDRVG